VTPWYAAVHPWLCVARVVIGGVYVQADLLRQQTLEQMRRILNTRELARALLVISDYFSRLRALSSLWLARPRD
jgi:hypothetical protein